jgi:1,4-dihydroxy-2-naphthoyl-CoA hydrolase
MSDNMADAVTESAPPTAFDIEQLARSPFIDRMGIQFVQLGPELLIGTMPVEGNTQPYGLLHGGASCVLAETLGSVGAAMHAFGMGKIALGIDLNATHHRGARSGVVTGTARPIHLGSTVASYEIVITDEQERRICTARLTCQLAPSPTIRPVG